MSKALLQKHLEAIEMRKQGLSYSQIKRELRVSKSSLSLWLRRYPLSKERIRELRDFSEQRIERFRNTMRLKKEKRLKEVYLNEKKYLFPLSKKELYLAGLLLYWGEGAKTKPFSASLSNTNPEIIKFFLFWLTDILKIHKEKICVKMHLYEDMDQGSILNYWSNLLEIPINQFKKPYIKKTTLRGLTYKTFGKGTCNLIVNNRDITEKIFMGIKAISDGYISK